MPHASMKPTVMAMPFPITAGKSLREVATVLPEIKMSEKRGRDEYEGNREAKRRRGREIVGKYLRCFESHQEQSS